MRCNEAEDTKNAVPNIAGTRPLMTNRRVNRVARTPCIVYIVGHRFDFDIFSI